MKLGGFGLIEHYESISAAGYDYAELDMPEIEALSNDAFAQFKDKTASVGLPVLIGARILPIAVPTFFIDGFKPSKLAPYLKHSSKRAAELGIKKVILGNGKARMLPNPASIKNEAAFLELLRMMSEISGENDQEMILEPLGPKYSNYINTLEEAVEIISRVNMKNLYIMADLRHMLWSKESLDDLSSFVNYVHHVHVDYPLSFPERGYPCAADDYDYSKFVNELIKSGYNDTLTIEADFPKDWKIARQGAIEVLQKLFK